jgi:tetratricopeptide (TPR) repeat protein
MALQELMSGQNSETKAGLPVRNTMSEDLHEDLPQVIEELEAKCKEHPNSVMAFHHLGLVYMKAGRIDEAITALKRAIEIDDLSSESMINLGAIYFGQGDLDKAQEMNEKAVKVNAESAQAHANLGLIWQQKSDFDKAIAAYERAIQHNPKLASAWMNLTSVLTMKGEDERAVKAARKGLELDPDSPLGHNNLAVALYFSEQFSEAKIHLDRAKELGYSVDANFVSSLQEKLSS